MSWSSRVVWQEGMFLRAQHFQQQDRWIEQVVQRRVAALGPHWWGVAEMAIDRGALSRGVFQLQSAAGVFPDGTPFAFPDDAADDPAGLALTEVPRDGMVYLALASPPLHEAQVAGPEAGLERRLTPHGFKAYDVHSGSPDAAELVVGRLRLRFLAGDADRAGYQYIPLVRVREITPSRTIVLDDDFIAPALHCRAAPTLARLIGELEGMLRQRIEALAGRLAGAGRNRAEQADFLLLQSLNRWLPLLHHWALDAVLHPLQLYETAVQMAGELATFNQESRRARTYPPYRHDDLQGSFAPVIADLRQWLAFVLPRGVHEIPLQDRGRGLRSGTITDRTELKDAMFYLVVRAGVPTELLRQQFPRVVKIGPIERIGELVTTAVRGIEVQPLPVAPPELPFLAEAVYFGLDRASQYWPMMDNSAAFAVHVSTEPPGLAMQLWVVRT